jgi:hypothetical protein
VAVRCAGYFAALESEYEVLRWGDFFTAKGGYVLANYTIPSFYRINGLIEQVRTLAPAEINRSELRRVVAHLRRRASLCGHPGGCVRERCAPGR